MYKPSVGTVRLSTPVDMLCVLPSLTMLDMTGIDSSDPQLWIVTEDKRLMFPVC